MLSNIKTKKVEKVITTLEDRIGHPFTGEKYTKSYYENIMIFKEITMCFFFKSSKLCFLQKDHIVFFIDLTKIIIIMFFF